MMSTMQPMEVGKWYKTGEILALLQDSQQSVAIRCEVQPQEDGTLKLRGDATTGSFPDE